MPGFELIGKEEAEATASIFKEGGILFAHGFDSLRKKFHVREFESAASKFFSVNHCQATQSRTSALKTALKAVGVAPGDEVITQSFNFIATVEAIHDCNAKPVICDVDKNLDFCIEDCLSKINKRTKAIVIVHMLGIGGPISKLFEIGKKLNIPIIEDACEIVGGFNDKGYYGTLGDIGVFSFDFGKNITCGEGGMLLTNNKKYYDYARSYTDHGHELNLKVPRGNDKAIMPGFNYRMTELQAAIGKVQLNKLKNIIVEHKRRYLILDNIFQDKQFVRQELNSCNGSYDTFILKDLNQKQRESILKILAKNSFGTKNLPDAMRWHCSFFWEHLIGKDGCNQSKKTFNLLSNSIAIPILIKRDLQEYENLATDLKMFFEKN